MFVQKYIQGLVACLGLLNVVQCIPMHLKDGGAVMTGKTLQVPIESKLRTRREVRHKLLKHTVLGELLAGIGPVQEGDEDSLFNLALDMALEEEYEHLLPTNSTIVIIYFSHFDESSTLDNFEQFLHDKNEADDTFDHSKNERMLSLIPVEGTDELKSDYFLVYRMQYGLGKYLLEFPNVLDWLIVPSYAKIWPNLRDAMDKMQNDPTYKVDVSLLISDEEAEVVKSMVEKHKDISYSVKDHPESGLSFVTLYNVKFDHLATLIYPLSQMSDVFSLEVLEKSTAFPAFRPNVDTSLLQNYFVTSVLQSGQEDNHKMWDSGLTGKGQVIQVVDAGLDTQNCFFYNDGATPKASGENNFYCSTSHPQVYLFRNQPESSKVVSYFAYSDCNTPSSGGHGTGVSGCTAGNAEGDGRTTKHDGVAKDARISFFDSGVPNSPSISTPVDLGLAFGIGHMDGAFIHTNSWGKPASSVFAFDSQDVSVDVFLHQYQESVVLFAAGNSGTDSRINPVYPHYINPPTVNSPCVAKNSICVGATEYDDDEHNVVAFSSVGPTSDNRLKPDLVAPGSGIVTAESSSSGNPTCSTHTTSGTSFSTPYLAGTVALIRQYFMEGYYPTGVKTSKNAFIPSGPLLKAMLISSADYVKGTYHGRPLTTDKPSFEQGFGEPNLSNILKFGSGSTSAPQVSSLMQSNNLEFGATDIKLSKDSVSSETHDNNSSVPISAYESLGAYGNYDNPPKVSENEILQQKITSDDKFFIKMTLAWYDYPSSSYTRAGDKTLVNDIDLKLFKVDENDAILETYYPNGLTGPDRVNNVEQIALNLEKGVYMIEIKGHRVPKGPQKIGFVVRTTGVLASDLSGGAVQLSTGLFYVFQLFFFAWMYN